MRIEKILNQTLIQGNCLDYMLHIPDNYFDLCLTDPPYGIDYGGKLRGKGDGKGGSDKNGWRSYDVPSWDKVRPDRIFFEEIFRVSKNQVIWGGNYFTDYLPPSRCWLIWDKGQRNFSMADAEIAFTSFDLNTKCYDLPRARAIDKTRFHPTQKPVELFKWCLSNFAKPGMKVFDPFMGSGTTLEACHLLGLEGVGIELDFGYFEKTLSRIKSVSRIRKLF